MVFLTSPHDWDTHYVRSPKESHSKEEEDLFTGIAAICIDAFQIKFHQT